MAPTGPLFTQAFIALSLAELAYFTATGLAIAVLPLFAAGPPAPAAAITVQPSERTR